MKTLSLLFTIPFLFIVSSALAQSNEMSRTQGGAFRSWPGTTRTIAPEYFGPRDDDQTRRANQEFHELFRRFQGHPDLQDSQKAVERAFAFFVKHKNGIQKSCGGAMPPNAPITNQEWIIVTDYTKPLDQPRQFLINIKTGEVITAPAAHGYGSNQPISACPEEHRIDCGSRGMKCRIPINMGNEGESGMTSRGFFITTEGYESGQDTFNSGSPPSRGINAIRMQGLLGGVNDNAYDRAVVLHRASYVQEETVKECSSSAGCPSITPSVFERIKNEISTGALVYLHTIEDEKKPQPDC